MAELSGRSGVPVPTVKFYLREGLLRAGERTGPNQARYDDTHLRRLALIRAMIDVGGLPVATVRAVLARLDDPDADDVTTLGKLQYALVPRREPVDDAAAQTATAAVEELLERHGWRVRPGHPARGALADAVAALLRLGRDDVLTALDGWAQASRRIAEADIAMVRSRPSPEEQAEGVVVLSVLGDAALAALRKLAEEDVISR